MQASKAGSEIFGCDAYHIAQVGANVAIAQTGARASGITLPLRLNLEPQFVGGFIARPQVDLVVGLGPGFWRIRVTWIRLSLVQAKGRKRLVKLGIRIMGILRVGKVQLVTRPQARDLR